ncbi:MAG: NADH-quinone oxidoreductase subunit L, partial [Acidobacteriota bacterium]
QELMQRASQNWQTGATVATTVTVLLLIGAMGKSAQLPLQTWLPDAMAGPTPVSALIHAATMVTAGVYLIARTHVLFQLAPAVMEAVAVTGALTLLVSGFAALAQRDIKRVLAYSTISQIGYMFLGLGVGSWTAALFHFVTHACFKALLFLGAGVVIQSMHEEHDIFKMGGLRKRLPVTFWTFLIASASLSAFPLVTGGFYSKDLILWKAWSSPFGGPWLWAAGAFGALLTGMYTFRMVFVAFFGELKSPFKKRVSIPVLIPLVTLAVLSVLTGYLETPASLGGIHLFSDFLGQVLPAVETAHAGTSEVVLQSVAAGLALLGIFIVYLLYVRAPKLPEVLAGSGLGRAVSAFWFSGWGFDWLYERILIRPFVALARLNRDDVVDRWPTALGRLNELGHRALRRTQSGKLRWYTAGVIIGAVSGILLLVIL